jgi:hypothetical protein
MTNFSMTTIDILIADVHRSRYILHQLYNGIFPTI